MQLREVMSWLYMSHLSGAQWGEVLYDPGPVLGLKLVGLGYRDSEMTLKINQVLYKTIR